MWWAKQEEIARALLEPPYKVLVKASHSVGKSHVAAGLVNWWYDTHDPGIVLTTAPTARQVRDVLWKEIRLQRGNRGGFPGPKIPRLESAPDHFAHGFTASAGDAAQGQHGPAILLVIDECTGVDREIWDAFHSQCQGRDYAWLAICNPTDTTTQAYQEEQSGDWRVIHVSALDHPNIAAELAGEPAPYPSAVRLAWLESRLLRWSDPVASDPDPARDVEWPPGSGKWYRPGPKAESRLLGRWPSASAGVWSDLLWAVVERPLPLPGPDVLPEAGCDVARFGDDDTAIHARCGPVSLGHEAHNGWGVDQTVGRLVQLARELAAWATARREPQAAPVDPKSIKLKVDDDGVGGGVCDFLRRDGYRVVGVNAAAVARRPDDYPNVRSELWFHAAERARLGFMSLALLTEETRRKLKGQAMAPEWWLDPAGRRKVEPKEDTKEKIGRSPDDMDAVNLAYYEPADLAGAQWAPPAATPPVPTRPQAPTREGERRDVPEPARIKLWGKR